MELLGTLLYRVLTNPITYCKPNRTGNWILTSMKTTSSSGQETRRNGSSSPWFPSLKKRQKQEEQQLLRENRPRAKSWREYLGELMAQKRKGEAPERSKRPPEQGAVVAKKDGMEVYEFRYPYRDFKAGKRETGPRWFLRKPCRALDNTPTTHDKISTVKSRYTTKFKNVVCPPQLYNRYKSVRAPLGGPVDAETYRLTSLQTATRGPPFAARRAHTAAGGIPDFLVEPGPAGEALELERLERNRLQPSQRQTAAACIPVAYGKAGYTEADYVKGCHDRNVRDLKSLLDKRVDASIKRREEALLKAAESAAVVKRSYATKKKGEDEAKPICGGCAALEAEAKKDPNAPEPVLHCKTRVSGVCPGPTQPVKPGDKPVSNPYWDNKSVSLSRCNRPRKTECVNPVPELPCDGVIY